MTPSHYGYKQDTTRKMLLSCVVLVLVSSALARSPNDLDLPDLDELWSSFKLTYNKQYTAEQEKTRRRAWEENVHVIRQHNLAADLGKHSFRLGLNDLADLTLQEYGHQVAGVVRQRSSGSASPALGPAALSAALPPSVDWRKQGAVTPVAVQGACGSSWAFAAAGALESQHFKATGKLIPLSPQNIVDCSTDEGNVGCSGGKPYKAFKYIVKNNGLDTNASYPYTAKGDQPCGFKPGNVGATMRGYLEVSAGSEVALQSAVASAGPVAVSIDSFHASFHLYKSGVYSEANCSSTYMDLGLLVVGYGTTQGQDYWLVKNNWGLTWGDQGYIMIARNKNNMCGIATEASYPVV